MQYFRNTAVNSSRVEHPDAILNPLPELGLLAATTTYAILAQYAVRPQTSMYAGIAQSVLAQSGPLRHSGPAMERTAYYLSILSWVLVSSCQPTSEPTPTQALTHAPTEIPRGVSEVGDAVQYQVAFEEATHHYISVRAIFPAPADSDVELSMAVWTPGSYLVREYARHIEELQFVDPAGKILPFEKTTKNRWRVHTGESRGLIAEYKLYCNELSVRTNFVDADNAVLNGAPTFLTMVEDQARAHEVVLTTPKNWKSAVSALDAPSSGAINHFVAKSYDELVDSPILAGTELEIQSFKIEEVPHRIVHLGDSSQWDLEEVLVDLTRLAEVEARFWGALPYERYDFLNVILGGGGGLEHLDSTLMLSGRFSTSSEKDYKRWLGLVAHEFFHTWNVKRLRPASLGPFDYENENYTRSLWVAEGITSYYDYLLLRRAGLLDEEEYLEKLSGQIKSLQETPGRLVQSLSSASFDSWIKYYRHDENSLNTSISYYTKGAVVAFLLDAAIRSARGGTKSLDDLMRLLYQRYSGDKGYTPEEFVAAANEVAGVDMAAFLSAAIDHRAELDYRPALNYYGLELSDAESVAKAKEDKKSEAGTEDEEEDKPGGWLGLIMRGDHVKNVKRGTPAFTSGFNAGDEILAVNGYRVGDGLDALLDNFQPGQEVRVTVSRRGRLRELQATLGEEPDGLWTLSESDKQSGIQGLRFRQWIAEDDEP